MKWLKGLRRGIGAHLITVQWHAAFSLCGEEVTRWPILLRNVTRNLLPPLTPPPCWRCLTCSMRFGGMGVVSLNTSQILKMLCELRQHLSRRNDSWLNHSESKSIIRYNHTNFCCYYLMNYEDKLMYQRMILKKEKSQGWLYSSQHDSKFIPIK